MTLLSCPLCQNPIEQRHFFSHCIDLHQVSSVNCPGCAKKYSLSNYFRSHLSKCIKNQDELKKQPVNCAQIDMIDNDPPEIDITTDNLDEPLNNSDFWEHLKSNFKFNLKFIFYALKVNLIIWKLNWK